MQDARRKTQGIRLQRGAWSVQRRISFPVRCTLTAERWASGRQALSPAFTLIEVMVVVVVIALAAGLGGGIYVGSYKRMVVEKAARDIWLMAKYARIAAIEQQQTLQLEFDRVNRRCWVSTESNGSTLESTIVRNGFCRPLELPAGVDFVGLSVGLPQSSAETGEEEISRVVFHPNGTADTAAIAVGDGKTLYGITINGATGGASLGVGEAALAVADLSVDLESK